MRKQRSSTILPSRMCGSSNCDAQAKLPAQATIGCSCPQGLDKQDFSGITTASITVLHPGSVEQILAAELEKAIIRGDRELTRFYANRLFEETLRESPAVMNWDSPEVSRG